jgi:hypothetical protein
MLKALLFMVSMALFEAVPFLPALTPGCQIFPPFIDGKRNSTKALLAFFVTPRAVIPEIRDLRHSVIFHSVTFLFRPL